MQTRVYWNPYIRTRTRVYVNVALRNDNSPQNCYSSSHYSIDKSFPQEALFLDALHNLAFPKKNFVQFGAGGDEFYFPIQLPTLFRSPTKLSIFLHPLTISAIGTTPQKNILPIT